MVDAWIPTTSATLLGRLRHDPSNEAAWDEFIEHYGRHIYRWCRQWRLQDADAEDVTQEVLLKLAASSADFAYNPESSFRGWLKTVAHHAWRDFVDGRSLARPHCRRTSLGAAAIRGSARRSHSEAGSRPSTTNCWKQPRLRCDFGWRRTLGRHFVSLAIEGLPVAEVAARVQIQVAMVYVAKSKVQKMLQEEIQKLETNI